VPTDQKDQLDEHQFLDRMVAEAVWGMQHEDPLHYSQDAAKRWAWRQGDVHDHCKLPTWMDCSSFGTYCIWRACAGDPKFDPSGSNGFHWGNSTSIYNYAKAHNRLVPMDEAKRGYLVVWPGKHVSILIAGPRHLGLKAAVASHGSESGPYKLDVEDELSLGKPNFVKTWVE